MSFVPELNDLIRAAYSAQEAFDNWDRGKTFTDKVFGGPRFCSLSEVCQELDAANLALVRFVRTCGEELETALATEARRAETTGSACEGAVPEGEMPK